jgi:hypothetical protein
MEPKQPRKPKEPKPTKTAIKKAERLAVRDASLMPFLVPKAEEKSLDAKPVKLTANQKQRQFIELIFAKNPKGRPRLYSSPEELEDEITAYLVHCYENSIKLTISGLVLFCGFSDRKSFYEYEENRAFTHIIKKARGIITLHYEGLLTEAFPQGAVFALKNLGWNAEEKIENTVKTQTEFYIGGDETQDIDYEFDED